MTVNDCQIRKNVKVWTKVQDLQHTGTGANLMSNAMWEVSIQITDKGSPEFWLLSGLKWVLQGSKNRSLHCIMTGNMALIGLTFAEANIIMNYKISWRICIYILVMNCDLSFSYFETTLLYTLVDRLTHWNGPGLRYPPSRAEFNSGGLTVIWWITTKWCFQPLSSVKHSSTSTSYNGPYITRVEPYYLIREVIELLELNIEYFYSRYDSTVEDLQ